jgi:hypothetical protein
MEVHTMQLRTMLAPLALALAAVLPGAALGAGTTGTAAVSSSPGSSETTAPTPCPTEVSQRCVWDAKHHGTGLGHSFVAWKREGRITIVRHRVAHRLLNATFRPVPDRMVGVTVDSIDGRHSFTVGQHAVWAVGDTTYVVTKRWQVGTS